MSSFLDRLLVIPGLVKRRSKEKLIRRDAQRNGESRDQAQRGLWKHRDFLGLWAAQTVSLFGTQVTALALPTIAILTLHADSFSVGALIALQWLAFLFVGPFAGVIADRLPRRRIMIVADLGRLMALASIPVVFAIGIRTIVLLYAIAIVIGILTVLFDVSYQAYLPTLVDRSSLVEGNTKLALTDGAAQVGGPALGGLLIQLVGAANAIAADACSYLGSALFLASIKRRESELTSAPQGQMRGILAEVREGTGVVFHHPVLRTIIIVNTAQNFGAAMAESVILIFAYRTLHLSPGLVGIAIAGGSVGFIFGALCASPIVRKFGLGLTLSITCLIGALSFFFVPLGLFGVPVAMVALWRFFYGFHVPSYDINQVSLRQALTSDRFQGRMNATFRTVSWGALGVGPLIGGFLGTHFGLIPVMLTGGTIFCVGSLLILTRSVSTLKEFPAPVLL